MGGRKIPFLVILAIALCFLLDVQIVSGLTCYFCGFGHRNRIHTHADENGTGHLKEITKSSLASLRQTNSTIGEPECQGEEFDEWYNCTELPHLVNEEVYCVKIVDTAKDVTKGCISKKSYTSLQDCIDKSGTQICVCEHDFCNGGSTTEIWSGLMSMSIAVLVLRRTVFL